MLNTSILLMALMTDAFSDAFTEMAARLAETFTAGFNGTSKEQTGPVKATQLKTGIPKQMVAQIIQMKADMKQQLEAKKKELGNKLADPKFDAGISIAEQYHVGIPNLTSDLDEQSLLTYIGLLKANDVRFTKMFQELMEWMKAVND